MATIYTRATKGSALTWTEGDANITNLNDDKIENIVEDTTPQLGGALDVNTFAITNSSTSTPDIVLQPNATGEGLVIIDGEGIEIDSPSEFGEFVNSAVGQNLVLTTGATNAPFISLVDGTNGSINIQPHGLGSVNIKNAQLSGEVRIADLDGSNYVGFKSPDTVSTNKIWTLPATDGSNGQVLSTNGTGALSWATAGGITDLVQDTTPQLGGNLDVNGQQIVSVSNGNIVLAPNGTGMTQLNNIEYHEKIHSLGTTSGTVAPNVANGNVQTITLNGNLTLNAFTSPIAGQSLTLIINTNGTGRTLTSTMKWAGGEKTLSTTSTTDIISVFYDGTNYWASLSKGFA